MIRKIVASHNTLSCFYSSIIFSKLFTFLTHTFDIFDKKKKKYLENNDVLLLFVRY